MQPDSIVVILLDERDEGTVYITIHILYIYRYHTITEYSEIHSGAFNGTIEFKMKHLE